MHTLKRDQAQGGRIAQVKSAAIGLLVLGLLLAAITAEVQVDLAPASVVLLVGAGLCSVGVGVAGVFRRSGTPFGLLIASAGCLWFVTQWNTADVNSAMLFTIGLVGWAAFPAVVAHAALAYPSGRLNTHHDRVGIVAGYVALVGLEGLVPALVLDPVNSGCRACPNNLLELSSAPAFADGLGRVGAVCSASMALGLVLLSVLRFLRSSPAGRRVIGSVLGCAVILLLATATMFVRAVVPATVPLDDTTRLLWSVQGIALIALSFGVVAEWIRLRRSRSRMARYVLDVGRFTTPADMRDVLAAELGDPTLELAYPLDDGRFVDASGASSNRGGDHRATTALVRDGSTVALLTHRADLATDHRLVEGVISAVRLPLDNERLSAQERAQVAELAASQMRIIQTGETERRRLERDLHDGAQQRLVALILAVRLARSAAVNADDAERIDEAIATLRDVIVAVRTLAAGIYPSVLAETGLRGGLAALAEESRFPVRVTAVPTRRLPTATETAVYLMISTLADCGAVTIAITDLGPLLTVDVGADAIPGSLTDVDDRITALGGTLSVDRSPGRQSTHAELPCG